MMMMMIWETGFKLAAEKRVQDAEPWTYLGSTASDFWESPPSDGPAPGRRGLPPLRLALWRRECRTFTVTVTVS